MIVVRNELVNFLDSPTVTVMRTVLLMCRLGTTSCIATNQCTPEAFAVANLTASAAGSEHWHTLEWWSKLVLLG